MKIPDFPSHNPAADDDLLLICPAGTIFTKQIKLVDLKAYLGTGTPEPPPSNQGILIYESNGDTNGVFYYIGSNKLLEAFTNPALNGRIVMSASSNLNAETSPLNLTAKTLGLGHTLQGIGEFFKLDLKAGNSLIVNHYTLKARSDYNGNYPRNWKLQASNDDATWIDIDTQINSTGLNFGTFVSIPIAGQTTAYRYWRLLLTGGDSSGAQYLILDEWEFYGNLVWS